MPPPKLRVDCERCGLTAHVERAGRFRDEDFYELLQEYFALEHHHSVRVHYLAAKLAAARERIEQMRELLNMLPDPVPEVEFSADDEENPFG